MDNLNLYMTLDEYNDFVSKAHAQYMADRLHQTSADSHKKHHPTDLAIETASFFEASYLVLDTYIDVLQSRIRTQKQEPVEPFFDLEPTKVKRKVRERRMLKSSFLFRTFTLITITGLAWLTLFDRLTEKNIIQTVLFSLFLSLALYLVRFNQKDIN